MIYKYGLINHFEKINAYLSIILLDGHQNIIPSQDEDMLVYEKDDKIYRIDIFNLKKYVKVKFQGLIYLPNYELIAILNGYLGKYNIMLSSKDESVEGIFLNFSDPWPKKRHAKRRLTSNSFLLEYYRILKKGAKLIFKTDNLDLFNYSLEVISESPFKLVDANRDYDGLDTFDATTEYERNFRELGQPIYRLILEKL